MTALNGLLVIELCGDRGQYMGKLMGDMGARVIKIEPVSGSQERNIGPFKNDIPNPNSSLYFWARNTSKESIAIDLNSTEGIKIIKQLLENADVFLEDYEPGFLGSIGLGYEGLSKANSSLIMTSLTGFGQDGPYKSYKSNDLVALAMGGIMHSCGYDDVPDSPPIRPSGGHGDFISAHYGLIGTLTALFYRDFTGQGQYLDVSAHEACSSTTEASIPTYLFLKKEVFRQTGRHQGATPTPKTLCKTSDGKYIIVFQLFNNLNSWMSLVKWMAGKGMAEDLEDEKFKDMARHVTSNPDDSDHAFEVVRSFILNHTADEIYRGAQELKYPWGIVRSPEENLEDPHFLEDRGMFEDILHPEFGEGVSYKYAGRPYRFKGTPWNAFRAPLIGEHSVSILKDDLNYSDEAIRNLEVTGIISSLKIEN